MEEAALQTRDWLTIAAIVLGPILAVQIQKVIEGFRENRARRQEVFNTLMATRMLRLSPVHVHALNRIDIEFYGRRFFGIRFQTPRQRAVISAWREYHQHLCNVPSEQDQRRWDRWIGESEDHFAQLMFDMGRALGYDFTVADIKQRCYRPDAHRHGEDQEQIIRRGLTEVLQGQRYIPIQIRSAEGDKKTITRAEWQVWKDVSEALGGGSADGADKP